MFLDTDFGQAAIHLMTTGPVDHLSKKHAGPTGSHKPLLFSCGEYKITLLLRFQVPADLNIIKIATFLRMELAAHSMPVYTQGVSRTNKKSGLQMSSRA